MKDLASGKGQDASLLKTYATMLGKFKKKVWGLLQKYSGCSIKYIILRSILRLRLPLGSRESLH